MKELFLSVEWAQMDAGTLTEKTAEPIVLKRFPERMHDKVRDLLYNWAYPRDMVAGMEELISRMKNTGYGIYLLSNASVAHHDYWPKFDVSRLFDGTFISCDYGIVKPNPEIYRLFTNRFGLNPEECLFVDDQPANVAAAIRCGWSGIVFHGSSEELKEKMKRYDI